MIFLRVFAILFAFLIIYCVAQRNTFEIKNFNCTGNPEYISKMDCVLRSHNRTFRYFNFTITIKRPIINVDANIAISRKPLITPGPYLKIMDITENCCDFFSGKTKSITLKTGYLMTKNFANLPSKCPIEPLTLAFLKVDYDKVGGKYLPSLFPNGRYKYVIKMFYHNITYGLVTLEMFINAIGILNND